MVELWLEVRDNDWYSAQLRERCPLFCGYGSALIPADAILKDYYVVPMIEQLNRASTLFEKLTRAEPLTPPKRRAKLRRVAIQILQWIEQSSARAWERL